MWEIKMNIVDGWKEETYRVNEVMVYISRRTNKVRKKKILRRHECVEGGREAWTERNQW